MTWTISSTSLASFGWQNKQAKIYPRVWHHVQLYGMTQCFGLRHALAGVVPVRLHSSRFPLLSVAVCTCNHVTWTPSLHSSCQTPRQVHQIYSSLCSCRSTVVVHSLALLGPALYCELLAEACGPARFLRMVCRTVLRHVTDTSSA